MNGTSLRGLLNRVFPFRLVMKTALHFLAFFLLCLAPRAEARRPIDRILLPKDVEDRDSFGTALAVNDRWIAVGDPNAEGEKGVVTIYSAITGRRVRELRAPDAADGDNFGASLSLCGNKLLIGAPESGNHMGAAYLMDVLSGRLIHRFQASPRPVLPRATVDRQQAMQRR